ncbi:MAG: ACT domain-containing protein [Oscillospiraceae bacterium]|nr:ACT domain-containing protein [Oscillospiraceae bacterium]
MKAIVTVIGTDRVGIIAAVCAMLASLKINILDISQTVMQEYFTMIMLVDTAECAQAFGEIAEQLEKLGERESLQIRIQREEIFHAMNRI